MTTLIDRSSDQLEAGPATAPTPDNPIVVTGWSTASSRIRDSSRLAGTWVADEAVATLQQLALDCAALSAELHLFAMPKIETSIGASKEELLDFVLSLDPAQIQQELEREQVEALQELGNASDWAPGELWGLNTHHRITVSWQGEQVETLADLLRPDLHAVCIGINPSPASVTAGHYYQGPIGRRFWQRLQRAGVIEETGTGREDDAAFLARVASC